MFIFSILMVTILSLIMAYHFREDIMNTLPMTISAMLLLLYILAFMKKLSWIDGISMIVLLFLAAYYTVMKKQKKNLFIKWFIAELKTGKIFVIFFVLFLISYLAKDRIALWWDDINYWAVDAKSLYFLNGFAGKYGNVAPEFGDYPPAMQLFKWWFLHFSPSKFHEGLMYAGYYCMNFIFLLPLLGKMKTKNPLLFFVGSIVIFLLPGMTDGIAFSGTCADVTMGIAYGALLAAIWDDEGHRRIFYYGRIALYLFVVILVKSVGIEWAAFALLLLIMKRISCKDKKDKRAVLFLFVFSALTEGSWLIFCLLRRRVAKLTSAGIRIAASDKSSLAGYAKEKIKYFLEGFTFYPMHGDKTFVIDLSALVFLMIIFAAILIYKKKNIVTKKNAYKLIVFGMITALASYGIIFLGHITIFAGELQYLDSAVMAKSIERYGAPFSIGMIYLLFFILIKNVNWKKGYLICMIMILVFTNYPGYYSAFYGYKNDAAKDRQDRESMIEEDAALFIEKAQTLSELSGRRTLYLRNDNVIHWVKDTYISYQVSPAAVVYNGIDTARMSSDEIAEKIKNSHAEYLYVDSVEGEAGPLFEKMIADGNFAYEQFYRITETEGNISLHEIK